MKYLDESGCCLESPVSYSDARIGEQKRIEQVKAYGDRISILGIWQAEQSFEYVLVQGSFNKERYVKAMNLIAQKSEQILKRTGKITVIVQLTRVTLPVSTGGSGSRKDCTYFSCPNTAQR